MHKTKLFALTVLGGLIWMSTACNQDKNFRGLEYMPDMYRGPALEAYSPYGRYSDSTSARLPVKGTVARGFLTYEEFSPEASGYDSAKVSMEIPSQFLTEAALEEGKVLYGIFCNACHGDKGDGKGILVQNEKFLGVPSYADRDINYGSIFHVVTYGKGVMGSHASQVTPEERWQLARYVMKLKQDLAPAGESES